MAVKNVIFNVSANTKNAEDSLNKLIEQLEKIKAGSKISLTQSTGNLDAQISALSSKLDKLAKDNKKKNKEEVDDFKKSQDQKKQEIDKAYAELDKKRQADLQKQKAALDNSVKEQSSSEQKKASEIKKAFDERDKAEKKRQSEQKAMLAQELKDFENINRAKKAAQQVLDAAKRKSDADEKARQAQKRKEDADAAKAARAQAKIDAEQRAAQSRAEQRQITGGFNRPGARQRGQDFGAVGNQINFISRAIANSSSNFVRLQNVIARTGVALGAISIGSAVATLGRQAIEAAKNFEVLKVSFTTLLGNAAVADRKIKELRTFAAETPFTTEEVFKASRILIGYGVEASKLLPTLRTLGDVAGGTGAPLERLALVFGQVRAAGRLYGQDLLQLINAGFNPLQDISKNTGKSVRELREEMRKGNVTFDDVNDAFIRATSAGGKFYGLTNALSQTTAGKVAKLKEEWQNLSIQIGTGLLPAFNFLVSVLRNIVSFLSELPKTISENRLIFAALATTTVYLSTAMFRYAQLRLIVTARTIAGNVADRISITYMAIKRGALSFLNGLYQLLTLRMSLATAATNTLTAAQARFNALATKNPLGIWVAVLTAIISLYYALKDSVDEANDGFVNSAEALAKVDEITNKNAEEQKKRLDDLYASIKKTTTATAERKALLDELNKTYKVNAQDLKNEADFLAALAIQYDKATQSVKDFAKAQAIEGVREEQYTQLFQTIGKLGSELEKAARQGIKPEKVIDLPKFKEEFGDLFLFSEENLKRLDSTAVANAQITTNQINNLQQKSFEAQKTNARETAGIYERGQIQRTLKAQESAVKSFGETILKFGKQALETKESIGALNSELKGVEGVSLFDPEEEQRLQKATDQFEDAVKRRKDGLESYYDLLNRIAKNNEDIRKKLVEFTPPVLFEDEIDQLKEIEKIEEEGIRREIRREQDKIRRELEQDRVLRELREKSLKIQADITLKTNKAANLEKAKEATEGLQKELTLIKDAIKEEESTRAKSRERIVLLDTVLQQELEKLYIDTNKKINDIERKGYQERRTLIQETKKLYDDLAIFRIETETRALQKAKEQTDELLDGFFDINEGERGAASARKRLRQIAREVIRDGKDFSLLTQKEISDKTKQVTAQANSEIAKTEAALSIVNAKIKNAEAAKAIAETTGEIQTPAQEAELNNLYNQQKTYEDKIVSIKAKTNERIFGISEDYFEFLRRQDQELIANSVEKEELNIRNIIARYENEKLQYQNNANDLINVENALENARAVQQKLRASGASAYQQKLADDTVTIYEDLYAKEVKATEKNGYEIARLEAQKQLEVTQAHEEGNQERTQITEETNEKEKSFREKLRDFFNSENADLKDSLQQFAKDVINIFQQINDAQVKQIEAAIKAQEKRVESAKEIADKGNVALLELEQERLDKLNRQRANFVRQQQSLAAVEIALNSAIAVSQAAGKPGAPFTIAAIIAAMAVGFAQARAQAQAAATFAKGGYTGDGHQFQAAGTVHKGEFVMNAQRTRQYRPMLEAMHAGRIPNLGKGLVEKTIVLNNRSMDEKLSRIETAIKEQNRLNLSIDENGINGIVSRISYKNQRIKGKAR